MVARWLRAVRLSWFGHDAARAARDVRTLQAHTRRIEAKYEQALHRARKLQSVAVDAQHLTSMLPLRAAALRGRRDDAAHQREADLLRRSDAYGPAKRAWEAGERPPGMRHARSAGLDWSIPIDAGDERSLSRRIERGWLPLHDIAAVRACVVGGVMLDIGANIGTTCIPRVVLGDFDCVYAAEPESGNYACLVGAVIDNGLAGRVLPDRVAIGSSNGTATLVRTGRIGGHRLTGDPSRVVAPIDVPCFTLDSWLSRLGVQPEAVTFVKVDTQGWEVEVLKGASSLLRCRHVVWQLEISRMVKRSGASLPELTDLLREHFTHARVLRGAPAGVRPIAEVVDDIRTVAAGAFTNLLVMNRS